jgi:two-component system alkaline phosphatase synthesis response regulator PhoP
VAQVIYVVEDDDNIRDLVCYALGTAGFEAVGVDDGKVFLEGLSERVPDLVLLDSMLPGRDGLGILHEIRENRRTAELPVIMMTAKGAEFDRIRGFEAGADDYIAKPFSVMELVLRVKAVLRRSGKGDGDESVLRLGELSLATDKRVVSFQGRDISLAYKEFELLLFLMEHKGIVLNRDQILNGVWGFDYDGESRTVDMHIKTLRQKLGDGGGYIKTVRNVGYKIEDKR